MFIINFCLLPVAYIFIWFPALYYFSAGIFHSCKVIISFLGWLIRYDISAMRDHANFKSNLHLVTSDDLAQDQGGDHD